MAWHRSPQAATHVMFHPLHQQETLHRFQLAQLAVKISDWAILNVTDIRLSVAFCGFFPKLMSKINSLPSRYIPSGVPDRPDGSEPTATRYSAIRFPPCTTFWVTRRKVWCTAQPLHFHLPLFTGNQFTVLWINTVHVYAHSLNQLDFYKKRANLSVPQFQQSNNHNDTQALQTSINLAVETATVRSYISQRDIQQQVLNKLSSQLMPWKILHTFNIKCSW